MAAPLQQNVITTLLLLLLLGSGPAQPSPAQPRLKPGCSGNVSKHVAHFAHTLAPTLPPPAHTPMLLAALMKEETDHIIGLLRAVLTSWLLFIPYVLFNDVGFHGLFSCFRLSATR